MSTTLGEIAELPGEVSELRERVARLEALIAALTSVPRFLTVGDFTTTYPEWTEGQLRWILFKRRTNGFAPAVIEGDPLRIDAAEFLRIVKERGRVIRRRKRRSA